MARFPIRLSVAVVIGLALSIITPGQTLQTPDTQLGKLMGTVTDVNGSAVVGATVVLTGSGPDGRRTSVTPESGFFEFDNVKPGITYHLGITAQGFADWTSAAISIQPGEFQIVSDIQLRIATQTTSVQVTYNPEEVATEQFKTEEGQRILGVIPNAYVVYDQNAEPLTSKMKFKLALKVATDPVTIGGVAFIAGVKQAANTPDYPQGAKGYGERFGAIAGDGFTDIMVGAAILPSVLHQDPRYFYQGSGSTGSRLRHAILNPFICRGDNGNWEPNYSSLGGDLVSSAVANIYYPAANRGAGLVFGNFAIGTAERVAASVAQEFLLSKLTRRGGHID